jgi:hypothetical protein
MHAEIGVSLLARVHVAAAPAQLRASHPTLDAARRDHAAPDPILSTFVIQDVARPKFSEAEEPRPLDGVRLIA